MKIPKLLVRISVPMVLSLLINSLYGVVDSIFVSRIGEKALAAPIQILIVALGGGKDSISNHVAGCYGIFFDCHNMFALSPTILYMTIRGKCID